MNRRSGAVAALHLEFVTGGCLGSGSLEIESPALRELPTEDNEWKGAGWMRLVSNLFRRCYLLSLESRGGRWKWGSVSSEN